MRHAAPRPSLPKAQLLRETGLAASALALWLLLLLSPLHQASLALAELRQAGALPSTAWALCLPVPSGAGDKLPAPKCPLCGPGVSFDTPKTELLPGFPRLARLAERDDIGRDPPVVWPSRLRPQPRAPPVSQGA